MLFKDEVITAAGVEDAVRDNGINACAAHSSREALCRLEAGLRTFAVLVTDINLGSGANGFDVAATARMRNPGIQVAYKTGRRENNEAAGMQALTLLKPFDAEYLAGPDKSWSAKGPLGPDEPSNVSAATPRGDGLTLKSPCEAARRNAAVDPSLQTRLDRQSAEGR